MVRFFMDEDGLTIVEYAIAGGVITLTVAMAFQLLGGAVASQIDVVTTAVSSN